MVYTSMSWPVFSFHSPGLILRARSLKYFCKQHCQQNIAKMSWRQVIQNPQTWTWRSMQMSHHTGQGHKSMHTTTTTTTPTRMQKIIWTWSSMHIIIFWKSAGHKVISLFNVLTWTEPGMRHQIPSGGTLNLERESLSGEASKPKTHSVRPATSITCQAFWNHVNWSPQIKSIFHTISQQEIQSSNKK